MRVLEWIGDLRRSGAGDPDGGLGAGGGPRARDLAGVNFGRTALGPDAARLAVGG